MANIGYNDGLSKDDTIEKIMSDYREAKETGNKRLEDNALERLIKLLDKLVIDVINKSFSSCKNRYFEDLLQAGRMAIIKDAPKYDESVSMPSTYFKNRILHAMIELMDGENGYTIHYGAEIRKINEAKKELEKNDVEATPENISNYTGITIKNVITAMDIKEKSLLKYATSDDEYESMLNNHADSPERIVETMMDEEIIHNAVASLPFEERVVVTCKYGIGCDPMKNKEISDNFGIPLDSIRSTLNKALATLKKSQAMRNNFKDNTVEAKKMLNNPGFIIPVIPYANSTSIMDDLIDDEGETEIFL